MQLYAMYIILCQQTSTSFTEERVKMKGVQVTPGSVSPGVIPNGYPQTEAVLTVASSLMQESARVGSSDRLP